MGEGIFLPSRDLGADFVISCLQALRGDFPSIQFTSFKIDATLHGLWIYFSEVDEAMVYKKKFITVGTRNVQIYPVTTFVTIYGIDPNADSEFKKDLEEALQHNFGTVLKITKLDHTYEFEEWLLELDAPEFKNLKVSGREIFSKRTIFLPQWKKKFAVAFWCGGCKDQGHFRHECTKEVAPEDGTEKGDGVNSGIAATSKNEMETTGGNQQTRSNSRSPGRNSSKRDEGHSKFVLEANDTFAEKIGTEVVLKTNFMAGNQKFMQTSLSNVSEDKEIKKEIESDETYSDALEQLKNDKKRKRSDDNEDHVPKKETPGCSHNNDGNAYEGNCSDDDGISIIDTSNDSNFSKKDSVSRQSSGAGQVSDKDEAVNSEASRSPTSYRSDDPHFSLTRTPAKKRVYTKPAAGVEVTSVLSDRLQDCITTACETNGVLDRKTLDAFLIHVKKKSNPLRVALNFTRNTTGLKEQLQKILHQYYNTPQTGTKEDIQFIKWLNGLVERFDGTLPRRRKPARN